MGKKISVKSVSIEIGSRELTLTPTEVEELHKALSDLLGKPKTTYTPFWIDWERQQWPTRIVHPFRSGTASDQITISCLADGQ